MDTAVFILAKLAGLGLRPDVWLLLALALIVWWQWRGRPVAARRAGSGLLAAVLALGFVPLGDLALAPLEGRHPVRPGLSDIAGVIVLGGAEDARGTRLRDQVQLNAAAERFTEALALARAHPQARVVFTGGSGALRDALGGGLSGADVAARFFAEQGLERAEFERTSRNTTENARASAALIDPQPGEVWVLVTSAFHMPRAIQSFRAAGWPGIQPWPVDFRGRPWRDRLGWDLMGNLGRLEIALREYLGLLAYGLAGR